MGRRQYCLIFLQGRLSSRGKGGFRLEWMFLFPFSILELYEDNVYEHMIERRKALLIYQAPRPMNS